MRRAGISRLLLFIIFLLWTTGELAAFSVGLGAIAGAQVAAGQGFEPKLQAGGSAAVDLAFPLVPGLALMTSIDLLEMLPSDPSGGFLYRGYGGGALALLAEGEMEIASSALVGELWLGGGLGGAAVFAGYQYTTLYFFYPEARASAFLDWHLASPSGIRIRMTIPLRVQFRRDLGYSISTGIGLGVAYQVGTK